MVCGQSFVTGGRFVQRRSVLQHSVYAPCSGSFGLLGLRTIFYGPYRSAGRAVISKPPLTSSPSKRLETIPRPGRRGDRDTQPTAMRGFEFGALRARDQLVSE
jgi:hypothetical protein